MQTGSLPKQTPCTSPSGLSALEEVRNRLARLVVRTARDVRQPVVLVHGATPHATNLGEACTSRSVPVGQHTLGDLLELHVAFLP